MPTVHCFEGEFYHLYLRAPEYTFMTAAIDCSGYWGKELTENIAYG